MAKFYNNRVKTGKLAGSVFSVRFGETIERAYQPIVANPNTPAQIANRAKMKLASQLSAVMGPYIAMPRKGAVSTRNLFVKNNYPSISYSSDQAQIDLAGIHLTTSNTALSTLSAVRGAGNIDINVETGTDGIDRVVYVAFVVQADGRLRFFDQKVVTTAGENGNWPTTMRLTSQELVVYAYGVRDNTEAARVAFGNMTVPAADAIAKLLVTSNLLESDVTLTETRYAHVDAEA